MTNSPTNRTRLDPYKNFKYRVFANDQEIPDISDVKQQKGQRSDDSIQSDDAVTAESFGLESPEPITLERGVTHDASFADWLGLLLTLANQPGGLVDISVIAREVRIEQVTEAGELIAVWQARNCRPLEYRAPKNSEDQSSSAPEILVLLHDGCERIS